MKIHAVAQGTEQWRKLRAGIPTASNFSRIMTLGKKKSSSQEGYMNDLLAERMLGRPWDGYKSQAMEDGNRFESHAVAAYEFAHDVTTYKVGFVTTDDGRIGCSPDRFVEEHPDEMVECKAPANPAIHVAYLRAAAGASDEYKVQLMGQLWVCEKARVKIISYFAGMPDAVFTVERDDKYIKELAAFVRAFSVRLEDQAEEFRNRGWIRTKDAEYQSGPEWITEADLEWAKSRTL